MVRASVLQEQHSNTPPTTGHSNTCSGGQHEAPLKHAEVCDITVAVRE